MTLACNVITAHDSVMSTRAFKSAKPGWALTGLAVSLLCLLTALASGLGYRLGWWGFREGFQLLGWAGGAGLLGVAISLGALLVNWSLNRTAMSCAAIGLVIGLMVVGVPLQWQQAMERRPRIHDITTDTDNPPAFVTVARLRSLWEHGIAYRGEPVALKQKSAYPDIRPLHLPLPAPKAYDVARAVLEEMDLQIVAHSPAEGRIEAVATTVLYGFKDDVVVRVQSGPMGALVDVRSMSRVGVSDLGKNAKRLRLFLSRLREKASITRNVQG